MGKKLKTSMSM